MKLRLNDTSVCLRFRRSEVLTLSESGTVTVTLPFPGSDPITFVARAAEVPQPAVSFRSGLVEVLIPAPAGTPLVLRGSGGHLRKSGWNRHPARKRFPEEFRCLSGR
jgi:hypothetical protein